MPTGGSAVAKEPMPISTVGHGEPPHADQDLRQGRDEGSVTCRVPDDSIEYYDAVEKFHPDDVDLATHNERRCNLPVDVCPACSTAEHDEGPVSDWMINPDAYELDE
jgi:hypothetical protein